MLISREESALLVVDVQEKLVPAVLDGERVISRIGFLMTAAARLDVPLLVSEQYPKGLGGTVAGIAKLTPPGGVMEKVHFSCLGDGGCSDRISSLGRGQVIVTGIETHVCVLQTVLALLDRGKTVFVVADAASSRGEGDHRLGLERMRHAGAVIVTAEMVFFEWLERADSPEFRDLRSLVK
ncbi:MAG TPA: hydrolase [Rhodospirillales bacterium]|nr:hydrolase [Rhodospirillales bacterium]